MNTNVNIRVRIAPSPTGFLHIGTARTALFNYLFAQKHGGKFVLRIEDTDLERSDQKYEKDIFEGLKWLGIDADESPEAGGPFAPYRQSERTASYRRCVEKLLAESKAFWCPHTKEELEAEQKSLMTEKRPPVHWCQARDGKETTGIIRFKSPREKEAVRFIDLVREDIEFSVSQIGDFSIAKNLDTPLYNFAVVVDDEEMQISHVIRGEDHIANTPKQVLLTKALGFQLPEYVHLPLILGSDRSKLSKRHGATSVIEYKEQGYLPEVLFNFMAFLGWNPGGEKEIFTKEDLINEFSLEKVQKSGAVFDITKLDWMNGEYIRAFKPEELLKRAKGFLPPESGKYPEDFILKVLSLEQPRLKKLSEIGERTEYFFKEPEYDKELLRWKTMSDQEVAGSLDEAIKILSKLETSASKEDIEQMFLAEIGEGDKGKVLWPLRAALSGKKASPGPFEIVEILGIEETIKRLQKATDLLK